MNISLDKKDRQLLDVLQEEGRTESDRSRRPGSPVAVSMWQTRQAARRRWHH